MEIIKEPFAVGDWVKIMDGRLRGWSGFVLKYDGLDDVYKVKITRDNSGEKVLINARVDADSLVACGISKHKNDLLILIDLALEMGDKEWFLELTTNLPEELPF